MDVVKERTARLGQLNERLETARQQVVPDLDAGRSFLDEIAAELDRVGKAMRHEMASSESSHQGVARSIQVVPPKLAEFLLVVFARTPQQMTSLGDLNEKFERRYLKMGRARALRYYWAEALKLLWEFSRSAARRGLRWIALYAWARWL
jgi:hypothetical protein